ncbi:MAG: transcriptional repressor [Eubacterium sp.]|nr:transcriptional repressor [Eubacterium sp.]SEG12302.1 Fur family transcriptional regulator, ferric uptake regulator [Eubacterium ruminantium]
MNDKMICSDNQKKGYKTKCKDLIMSYIEAHKNERFSASDISEYITGMDISTNITTIYRNLDKLTAEGRLLKTKNPVNDCCFYQYAGEDKLCDGHLHMQCKVCGKVIHLNDRYMAEVYSYLKKETGFRLDFKASILMGICKDCRILPI